MVALLHEDATMTMPPFAWWLQGRDPIRVALEHSDGSCVGARLLPTMANGSPAFGQYQPDGDVFRPFSLNVLELAGGRIVHTTTFLDATEDFPRFGLPTLIRADEFPPRPS